MKFIHNRDKDCISILSPEQHLILKIAGNPLLFCQKHNGFLIGCGKETIRIDIDTHKNHRSLDVFYKKNHILSFSAETPERPACLSIYDELPSLLSIPKLSDIQKNKWLLVDYREHFDMAFSPPKIRIQKIKQLRLSAPMNNKKARFREL